MSNPDGGSEGGAGDGGGGTSVCLLWISLVSVLVPDRSALIP